MEIKPLDNFKLLAKFSCLTVSVIFSTSVHAHQGSSGTKPRLVCAEKQLGEACQWQDNHSATYIGTCRQVSSSLLCVRNKPIIYAENKENNKNAESHRHDIK